MIARFSQIVQPLIQCTKFLISLEVANCFKDIKSKIANAFVTANSDNIPVVLERDTSDLAMSATISQDNTHVDFFSRSLSDSERRHSAVEKVAL